MLRPSSVTSAICPQCDQAGIHTSINDCLAALRATRDAYTPPAPIPDPTPDPQLILPPMPEPPPESDEFVTVTEACALAKVSRRTIYNWLDGGKLRTIRTAGGRLRIRATSLFRT